MGAMRFLVPRRERMAADAVERATFSGIDEIPWQTRTPGPTRDWSWSVRRATRATFPSPARSPDTAS